MEYRNLGNSGLKVSALSIGGWLTFGASVGQDDAAAILTHAVDRGVNFIDLADVYARGQSELVAGHWLSGFVQRGGQRSDLVLSSKVFWPMSDNPNDRGLSRKHILESCHKSLRRLGTDYLDLYFCHRYDPTTPLEETVRAMEDLVRQGKVLYWGTSVWAPEALREAVSLCNRRGWTAPIVEQPCFNLAQRGIERDVLPTARELGMGVVVWSPLGQGLLTGKYDAGVPDQSRAARTQWMTELLSPPNLERSRAFSALARELGTTPSALAIAWVLRQPGISSAITGATRIAQLDENLRGVSLQLSDEAVAQIEAIWTTP